MKFIKLLRGATSHHMFLKHIEDSMVGWVSDSGRYLITLLDGETGLKGYDDDYNHHDYVRCYRLANGGKPEAELGRIRCRKDGSAAFVITEIMEIMSKHVLGGYAVVADYVRNFAEEISGGKTKWILTPTSVMETTEHSYTWLLVDLTLFQRYKVKQGSKT